MLEVDQVTHCAINKSVFFDVVYIQLCNIRGQKMFDLLVDGYDIGIFFHLARSLAIIHSRVRWGYRESKITRVGAGTIFGTVIRPIRRSSLIICCRKGIWRRGGIGRRGRSTWITMIFAVRRCSLLTFIWRSQHSSTLLYHSFPDWPNYRLWTAVDATTLFRHSASLRLSPDLLLRN